jgi:hypothetical protein
MDFDAIVIDLFNLYFRLANKVKEKENYKLVLTTIINHIEENFHKYLITPSTKIYFLVDPIPKTKKEFNTLRQNILPSYKSNRTYSLTDIKNITLLKKYVERRNPQYVELYDGINEADDFVEPLIEYLNKNNLKNILLYTTDSDWFRYLSPTIKVWKHINEDFTDEDFYKEFHFYPTIASITLMKAFFGDSSDKILSVVSEFDHRKDALPYISRAEQWIKQISEKKETLEEVVDRLKSYNFRTLREAKDIDKNFEKQFIFTLINDEKTIDKNLLTTLIRNIKIISSTKPDIEKGWYSWGEKDSGWCNLIDLTLHINKYEDKFSSTFGKVE